MATKEIDIQHVAKRIREEYDYLDRIPLKGWFWEIVRRTKAYRDFYERAVRLSKVFTYPPTNEPGTPKWILLSQLIRFRLIYAESDQPWSLLTR